MTRHDLGLTSWFLPIRGVGAVHWASEAGFGHLHIDMTDVTYNNADELNLECQQTGISLAGLSISTLETIGFRGSEARAAVDIAIWSALQLNISYVYLPSFGSALIQSTSDMRASAKLIQYAADLAFENGVTIATENTLSAPALSDFFGHIDRDSVELLLDTQNLSIRAIDTLRVVEEHGVRVRSFAHVKDGTKELGTSRLGQGNASVELTIHSLLSQGFGGTFIIESDYRIGEEAAYEYDSTWLLNAISESEGTA